MCSAIRSDTLPIFQHLLNYYELGEDLGHGSTAMHFACYFQRLDFCTTIRMNDSSCGAAESLLAKNDFGQTPLDVAMRWQDLELETERDFCETIELWTKQAVEAKAKFDDDSKVVIHYEKIAGLCGYIGLLYGCWIFMFNGNTGQSNQMIS